MRNHEIEAWALRVIDHLKARRPNEDSLVELKREWPMDIPKATRRIAGHANAARDAPILWLIGVSPDGAVPGVLGYDLAAWYQQIAGQFDGPIPQFQDINVFVDGVIVGALLFETYRAPYVVRNPMAGQPNGGPVALEVPWRVGTAVKSAGHAELIRILSPLQEIPKLEPMGGTLNRQPAAAQRPKTDRVLRWHLTLRIYITHVPDPPVYFPFHRSMGHFAVEGYFPRTPFERVVFEPPKNSMTMHRSSTELLITGPGTTDIEVTGYTHAIDGDDFTLDAQIDFTVWPVDSDAPSTLAVNLSLSRHDAGRDHIGWEFGNHDW